MAGIASRLSSQSSRLVADLDCAHRSPLCGADPFGRHSACRWGVEPSFCRHSPLLCRGADLDLPHRSLNASGADSSVRHSTRDLGVVESRRRSPATSKAACRTCASLVSSATMSRRSVDRSQCTRRPSCRALLGIPAVLVKLGTAHQKGPPQRCLTSFLFLLRSKGDGHRWETEPGQHRCETERGNSIDEKQPNHKPIATAHWPVHHWGDQTNDHSNLTPGPSIGFPQKTQGVDPGWFQWKMVSGELRNVRHGGDSATEGKRKKMCTMGKVGSRGPSTPAHTPLLRP